MSAWVALVPTVLVVLILGWLLWPEPSRHADERRRALVLTEQERLWRVRNLPPRYRQEYPSYYEHRVKDGKVRVYEPHLRTPHIGGSRILFNVPEGAKLLRVFMYIPSVVIGSRLVTQGCWRHLAPIAVQPGIYMIAFVEPWVTEDHLVVSYE